MTACDEATVFATRRLTKTYHVDADVFALRDLSLQLPESEFGVLLGPRGPAPEPQSLSRRMATNAIVAHWAFGSQRTYTD